MSGGIFDLFNNQIDINRAFLNLTLVGQGIDNTIVQSASDTSLSAQRVFKIYSGNTVTLKNMTIRNGRANADLSGDGYTHGGGIFNLYSNLTIENCKVTENVSGITGIGSGIGICNVRGTLTILNSTISHNKGIFSTSVSCYGGGIASIDGNTSISNSTISFNIAPSAGGIALISTGDNSSNSNFEIQNSTISENRGYNTCGGIRISRWGPNNSKTITANFNSCTVFKNYAGTDEQNFGLYGGIAANSELDTTGIQTNIKNSIFAGNKSAYNIDLSFQIGIGIINSEGYNIIQNYQGEAITGQASNGIGLVPNLQTLADNPSTNNTQTCAILTGSPALDAIPGGNGAPLFDQRGYQRVGNYDVGAYEYSNISEINEEKQLPLTFLLEQNYPNPFNPNTTIKFNIPEAGNVKLSVYNLLGQQVYILLNEFREAGSHKINFNAANLNSGIYLYKIETNGLTKAKKMTLIK